MNKEPEMNDLLIDSLFDMEIVNSFQYSGLSVDRETNKTIEFRKIESVKSDYKGYVPKVMHWGDNLNISWSLLVKITTPIKLNLINTEG